MKKLGIFVATASLLAMVGGSAWAEHDRDRSRDRDRDRGHERSNDRGRDHGRQHNRGVSRQEVLRDFLISFDRLDLNGDYRVGRREMERASHRRRDHNGRRQYNQNYRRHGNQNQVLNQRTFRRFDLNNNGKLTRKELRRGVNRAFNRADRNNNGYLGPRELENARWYNGGNNRYNDRDRRRHNDRRDHRR